MQGFKAALSTLPDELPQPPDTHLFSCSRCGYPMPAEQPALPGNRNVQRYTFVKGCNLLCFQTVEQQPSILEQSPQIAHTKDSLMGLSRPEPVLTRAAATAFLSWLRAASPDVAAAVR